MPTEQCVFLILYIHSIYGIFYMYITKYGCVFVSCAALRANVAGRIGNRVSPAESAFSANRIGI